MLHVDQISAGPVDSNIFLITRGNTRVMIDAGSGLYNKIVEKDLIDLLRGESLNGIILTHEHFDHSGGAKYLSEKFNAPLFSSPECARIMREGDPTLTGSFLFGADMEPVSNITEVEGTLDIGEISFEIHSTPGHAPGLISLITVENRHLFCGDLVFCDGGVGRWDLPGGDLDLLRRSVKESLEWDVSTLYPGHGRIETKDPKKEMRIAFSMLQSI